MDKTYISPHERLKKYALEDISSVYEDFHLSQDGLNEARSFRCGINTAVIRLVMR